jgi:hypothetical protein
VIKMFLKSATAVSSAGDHSCLYHSLSFLLCRENLYDKNGFIMRQLVNDYIRDNLFKVVWTSPCNSEPFFDAIHGEGFVTVYGYTVTVYGSLTLRFTGSRDFSRLPRIS